MRGGSSQSKPAWLNPSLGYFTTPAFSFLIAVAKFVTHVPSWLTRSTYVNRAGKLRRRGVQG
jgi:hypothetical protein